MVGSRLTNSTMDKKELFESIRQNREMYKRALERSLVSRHETIRHCERIIESQMNRIADNKKNILVLQEELKKL